jgi:type IV pilus assembly protein PilM
MSALTSLARILQDPPPAHIFEISEAGIAYARNDGSGRVEFRPLPPDVVSPSPLRDNILAPDTFSHEIRALAPAAAARKRGRAALILPDFASRIAVLDFDTFPSDAHEQLSLVRFRMKKSVPFEVESAVVSFHAQPVPGSKRYEVIVGLAALEIVARYEAPFRSAGFHPGFVTISTIAALNLAPQSSFVLARLSGRVLTVTVSEGPVLRLVRCIELPEVSSTEITNVLFPTFAYIDDQLTSKPSMLLLCGFEDQTDEYARDWQRELNLPVEPLQSRYGMPGPNNAGLLGFLEGQVQ